MATKRILVRTPRGIRSIQTQPEFTGVDNSLKVTQAITSGSNLIVHNTNVLFKTAYYQDTSNWWQTLPVNTDDTSDPLNNVYVYSSNSLGTIDLYLKP